MSTTLTATGHVYTHCGQPYVWIRRFDFCGEPFGFWLEGPTCECDCWHPWNLPMPPNWLLDGIDYVGPITIIYKQVTNERTV